MNWTTGFRTAGAGGRAGEEEQGAKGGQDDGRHCGHLHRLLASFLHNVGFWLGFAISYPYYLFHRRYVVLPFCPTCPSLPKKVKIQIKPLYYQIAQSFEGFSYSRPTMIPETQIYQRRQVLNWEFWIFIRYIWTCLNLHLKFQIFLENFHNLISIHNGNPKLCLNSDHLF